MKGWDATTVLLTLLAAVIGAHLVVGLIAVGACLWHGDRCVGVDIRYWFGEPLAATLGLLGGRALQPKGGL